MIEHQNCRVCNSSESKKIHPFYIDFKDTRFFYRRCKSCKTTFLTPTPSQAMFEEIYSAQNYHNVHDEDNVKFGKYHESVSILLNRFATDSTKVLDYGCGFGDFIKEMKSNNYNIVGAEFDSEAVNIAKQRTKCEIFHIEDLDKVESKFQLIHLGDVLEHLTDPIDKLNSLSKILTDDGYFYIEGPLEDNSSLVLFFSKLYLKLKLVIEKDAKRYGIPAHLTRFTRNSQKNFFLLLEDSFEIVYWSVYESGFPYINNGHIKHFIARLSILISKIIGPNIIGSRFRIILKKI